MTYYAIKYAQSIVKWETRIRFIIYIYKECEKNG